MNCECPIFTFCAQRTTFIVTAFIASKESRVKHTKLSNVEAFTSQATERSKDVPAERLQHYTLNAQDIKDWVRLCCLQTSEKVNSLFSLKKKTGQSTL